VCLINFLDSFLMNLEMWSVLCIILLKNLLKIPPIYYTKYLAKNEKSIPRKYLELLGGPKIKFHFFILYKKYATRKNRKSYSTLSF
jgi:hypothetical protein